MTELQWLGWIVWLGILIKYFPTEFFPKLKQEKTYQHIVFSSCIFLFILWGLRAGIKEGLDVHFLAMTVLTLTHGWRIAALISTIPIIALALFGFVSTADLGTYALINTVFPALLSYGVFCLSFHYLPRNLFVFIFVAGFFNGALNIAVQLLLTSGWLYFTDVHTWQSIVDNYLIFLPLLLFPEGLLNGMAITLLTIFRPEWIRTFSDRQYLYKHPSDKN